MKLVENLSNRGKRMDKRSVLPSKLDPNRKLTEEEYRTILDFLYAYHFDEQSAETNQMYEILRFLTEYFGCKCASLWLVTPDTKMTEPIGFNIDPEILSEYERNYQYIDEFSMERVQQDNSATTTVVRMNDEQRRPSGYYDALKERNISQKYGIIIRDNGKIVGAIGLFKSTENQDEMDQFLSTYCLEVLAPFIAQEFIKTRKLDSFSKSSSILHTVLNTSDVGLALFDTNDPFHLIYYNPVCTRYCYDLTDPKKHSDNIVGSFIAEIIERLGTMWIPLKEVSLNYSTVRGEKFKVRIIENSDDIGMPSTCTMFIIPNDSSDGAQEEDAAYTDLFSQLTSREQEIAMMIAKGYTNSEIAEKLFISVSTVKSHIQHIFEKADVSNRTSLMALLK